MTTITDRGRAALLSRIDRLEQEMVADWGAQGREQVAQVRQQVAEARERQLPRRRWWLLWIR